MAVQWYPGHMHKAQKDIKEVLSRVDLLIEVLDARIPHSSENPAIAKLRGDLPCIKLLNKSDLADPLATEAWQAHLESSRGVRALATSSEQPAAIKALVSQCRQLVPHKGGVGKPVNAMIVGIPNVGKSTIINTLAGRSIARTGNEPAVTKAQQRIEIDQSVVLHDTPGILWPRIDNPNSSYRLATTGAIKDTAMEYDDVCFFLVEYLLQAYPQLLRERFDLADLPESEIEFLEAAAARRGALGKGGRVNLHKICELVIHELRSGSLGRITLESPAMIEAEMQQVAEELARKVAEKAARKQRFKKGG